MPNKSPGKASFAKSAKLKAAGASGGVAGGGGVGVTPFGAMLGKKSLLGGAAGGGAGGAEAHGILEGISSLHSWIKTQTMIRPHARGGAGGRVGGRLAGIYDEDLDEDVVITLTAKNPQAPKNVVRFDHTAGEYASVKLNETMIDHLDIESTCLHKESAEAKAQIDRSGGHYRNDRVTGWKPSKKKKKTSGMVTTVEEAPTPGQWSRRQSSADHQLSRQSSRQLPAVPAATAAGSNNKLSPTPTPTPVGDKKFSFKQISVDENENDEDDEDVTTGAADKSSKSDDGAKTTGAAGSGTAANVARAASPAGSIAGNEEEEGEDGKSRRRPSSGKPDSASGRPRSGSKTPATTTGGGGNNSDDEDGGEKKLQNQFSFVERATQTMNNAMKCEDVQTEPPPRASFADTVNQWIIYDAYTGYENAKEAQEEMERLKGRKEAEPTNSFNIKRLLGEKKSDPNEDVNRKLLKAARILERMVNQNTYNDIALDFKYWEDASDEFRETEGTLLPLWKFNFDRAKGMEVTALCWNPAYNDLFAVAFGSYNFYDDKSRPSYVCVYSLKNPSYPEFVCRADCGVMCVDVHPRHPHMLAAGTADGAVAVYNMQGGGGAGVIKPDYIATARNGKHQDITWQVKWAKDNLDGYLNLYSVSGDGRVTNWTIVKTALWYTDIMYITFSKRLDNFSEDIVKDHLREGGRCVTFNPTDETMFLVGTDEGLIYKCTTEYSSKYLETYHAHNTPIYNIAWNPYVTSVFLTCAAEWMVKIWDHKANKPLFMFDLNAQVGDVAWAPYSSTIFAAVTVDGKVHVFDLHVDKYHPICSQPVVPRKKARLNHISFNAHHPIIIVGDSRGSIHCLKLSPNLRRQTKEVRSAMLNKEPKKALELEVKKLESLLAMVKEPDDSTKMNIGEDSIH